MMTECIKESRWYRHFQFDSRRVYTPRFHSIRFLLVLRAILFIYTLAVWIASIRYDTQHGYIRTHFAYFTNLSYTGLLAFLACSLLHTAAYCHWQLNLFLQMPRILRLLHWVFFESVLLFAVVVTGIFWSAIYNADDILSKEKWWLTVSVHAFNLVSILADAVAGSMLFASHWLHPLLLICIVVLYLALAYVNKAINGIFTYDFIDYQQHHWLVLAYAFAIMAGIVLVYYLLYGLLQLLDRLFPAKFDPDQFAALNANARGNSQ